MNAADKASLLADIDAGLTLLTSTRKPNEKTIDRAVTVFQGVKVACQTIAISPVGDTGVDPTPGPEDPDVDPAPPENPPVGGGGGGSTGPPPVTTVTTTYSSLGDFSGTQGFRGWYYMSASGANLTYSSTNQIWTGTEQYQGIWSSGQHPGATNGAQRRWVAQGTGTYAITGSVSDADVTAGNNVTFTIKKNGTTIYGPITLVSGDATGFNITGVTGSAATSDTFDFIVAGVGGIAFASTNVNVSIALTTQSTTGGGNPTQTTLPFTLNGTAPQEGTYTLVANKPSNADGCTIAITGVNLAAAYGRCYFNGSTNSMAIWATAPGNSGISAVVTLTVPVAYMVNGNNTLRFTHDSGAGYTITAIATPVFTTPVTPTPPATQTSLPFNLMGTILPEDALLTLSVSKPSNADSCTVAVTGADLDSAEGTMAVNGTTNSMTIFPVNAANDGVSRTVNLSVPPSWFVNGNNTIRFTHTSTAGFTVTAVNVSFTTPSTGGGGGTVPQPGTGTWPNLPSGMTVILNEPFSGNLQPGWENVYNTQSYASFSTAPLSPPTVFDSYFAGENGNGQWVYSLGYNKREVYVGLYWATNSQFIGYNNTNNKFFFVKSGTSVDAVDNSFMVYQGSPGSSSKVLKWYQQARVNNTQAQPSFNMNWPVDGTGWLEPNVSSSAATVGVGSGFHRVELYMMSSTSQTSANGIVRIWVDGQLSTNFTNFNFEYPTFGNFQINHAWDGPGGRDTSITWHHYFDHLVLATR